MLKEKYLKDFDVIDQTKPKGQKILTSFKNELKQIFDDFQRRSFLGDFPSERIEAEFYDCTTFYNELSETYKLLPKYLNNDENHKLIIYKNVYDDVFIYLSNNSKEESKKIFREAPPLNEYIFLLDEKYKIKKNENEIAYINSFRTGYSYFKKGVDVSYKLSYVSIQSSYRTEYLKKEDKYKNSYSSLKINNNKSLYYFNSNVSQEYKSVRFNDYDTNELICIDKSLNQYNDNVTLSHRLENYRVDYEISKNKILITISQENFADDFYHQTIFEMKNDINILDNNDSFQINNYNFHSYKDIESLVDLCMLEQDIEIDKKDLPLLKQITFKIPEIYDFVKNLYIKEQFFTEKTIEIYKSIIDEKSIKNTKRIKND